MACALTMLGNEAPPSPTAHPHRLTGGVGPAISVRFLGFRVSKVARWAQLIFDSYQLLQRKIVRVVEVTNLFTNEGV